VTVWNVIPVFSAGNDLCITSVCKSARFCFLFARNLQRKGPAPACLPQAWRNKAAFDYERGSIRRETAGRGAQSINLLKTAWLSNS
jgi:hypothetical protein